MVRRNPIWRTLSTHVRMISVWVAYSGLPVGCGVVCRAGNALSGLPGSASIMLPSLITRTPVNLSDPHALTAALESAQFRAAISDLRLDRWNLNVLYWRNLNAIENAYMAAKTHECSSEEIRAAVDKWIEGFHYAWLTLGYVSTTLRSGEDVTQEQIEAQNSQDKASIEALKAAGLHAEILVKLKNPPKHVIATFRSAQKSVLTGLSACQERVAAVRRSDDVAVQAFQHYRAQNKLPIQEKAVATTFTPPR